MARLRGNNGCPADKWRALCLRRAGRCSVMNTLKCPENISAFRICGAITRLRWPRAAFYGSALDWTRYEIFTGTQSMHFQTVGRGRDYLFAVLFSHRQLFCLRRCDCFLIFLLFRNNSYIIIIVNSFYFVRVKPLKKQFKLTKCFFFL